MEIRYEKHWSGWLNRDMEFKIYGSCGKPVMFHSLFTSCKSRSEIVATFLAVLELLRNGRIDMEDDGDDIALELVNE